MAFCSTCGERLEEAARFCRQCGAATTVAPSASATVAPAAGATGGAAAGWHPDPQSPGQLRYWDGARWTEHRAPASAGPQRAGRPHAPGLAVAGFVCGLLAVVPLIMALLAAAVWLVIRQVS